jgi:hypothetical protein
VNTTCKEKRSTFNTRNKHVTCVTDFEINRKGWAKTLKRVFADLFLILNKILRRQEIILTQGLAWSLNLTDRRGDTMEQR